VCYGSWGMNHAKVACRQLGFTKAVGYWYYGRGSGKVWLYNIGCSGTETSLGSCSHNGWGKVGSHCSSHTYDVGVVCSRSIYTFFFNYRVCCIVWIVHILNTTKQACSHLLNIKRRKTSVLSYSPSNNSFITSCKGAKTTATTSFQKISTLQVDCSPQNSIWLIDAVSLI